MTVILNTPNCSSDIGNTGVGECPKNLDYIKGYLVGPINKVFTQAELVDFEATLAPLLIATNPLQRVYPVIGFEDFVDKSKEQQVSTSGFGVERPLTGTAKYVFEHMYYLGMDFNNELAKFNNNNSFGVIACLADGTYLGETKADANGADGLGFVRYDSFNVAPFKFHDGKKHAEYKLTIAIHSIDSFNKNYGYIESTYEKMEALLGLVNVVHTTTGGVLKAYIDVYKLHPKVSMLKNLYSTYYANFAAWVIKKAGVPCTVGTSANSLTTIAYNATTDKLEVSFYAGSSGIFTFEAVSPTALAALHIGGAPGNYYEDVSVTSATVTAT